MKKLVYFIIGLALIISLFNLMSEASAKAFALFGLLVLALAVSVIGMYLGVSHILERLGDDDDDHFDPTQHLGI